MKSRFLMSNDKSFRDSHLVEIKAEGPKAVYRKRRAGSTERTYLDQNNNINKRVCSEQSNKVGYSETDAVNSQSTFSNQVEYIAKLGLIKPLEPQKRCGWDQINSGFKCPNVVAGKDGIIRPATERSTRNLLKNDLNKNNNASRIVVSKKDETEGVVEIRNNPERPEKKSPGLVPRPRSSLEEGDLNPSASVANISEELRVDRLDFESSLNGSLEQLEKINEPMVAGCEFENESVSDLPVSSKCPTEVSKPNVSENFVKWKLKILPQAGMDPEKLALDLQYAMIADGDGDRALHIAVVHQDVLLVRQLASLMRGIGSTIDLYNHMHQTPLHLAVILQNPHLCEALLEEGANKHAQDRHGNTAMHLAIEHNTNESLLVLIRSNTNKGDLNIRNYEGLSCLHLAISKKNMLGAFYLVRAGCDIDIKDGKSGRTALMHAVFARNVDIVKILLKFGASCKAPDFAGNSALSVANELGLKEIIILLESRTISRTRV